MNFRAWAEISELASQMNYLYAKKRFERSAVCRPACESTCAPGRHTALLRPYRTFLCFDHCLPDERHTKKRARRHQTPVAYTPHGAAAHACHAVCSSAHRHPVLTQCSPSAHTVFIQCASDLLRPPREGHRPARGVYATLISPLYLPVHLPVHLPISPYISLYLLHAQYAQLAPRALGQRLPLVDLQEM